MYYIYLIVTIGTDLSVPKSLLVQLQAPDPNMSGKLHGVPSDVLDPLHDVLDALQRLYHTEKKYKCDSVTTLLHQVLGSAPQCIPHDIPFLKEVVVVVENYRHWDYPMVIYAINSLRLLEDRKSSLFVYEKLDEFLRNLREKLLWC